mmetsp:Transcript_7545/g.31221  ORF Transcript_7545/g.31221 Transcript_7545/m.31221 type:complete len:223 (-) Transcript_7545:46-714(-)
MRLQGRRDHAAHRGIHGPHQGVVALHESGQRVPEPHVHRLGLHVRLRRLVRLDGPGHVLQPRGRDPRRGLQQARRDHHLRAPARPRPRGARPLGRREQHLPVRPPRLRRRQRRRDRLPLHVHEGPRQGRVEPPVGRRGRAQGRHVVRLRRADAPLRPGDAERRGALKFVSDPRSKKRRPFFLFATPATSPEPWSSSYSIEEQPVCCRLAVYRRSPPWRQRAR